jgi:hypothetical protein
MFREFWSAQGANPHAIDLYWESFEVVEIEDGKLEEAQKRIDYIYKDTLTISEILIEMQHFFNNQMIKRGYPEETI